MSISRRAFLFGSVSAPAMAFGATQALAWTTQDVGPRDEALMAARCNVSLHGDHLTRALKLLGAAGIATPLTVAQACPICGCDIQPG
ncbi:hypothetical protein L2U69_11575 [Zavarzinia compransoris]|uniref:hypothetical protein n=1 Tax=Zavarzinia marina TaxID=2911065 RepID=UPI001F15950E|nr:hypothetical protein [Zavarzinia marina]MCF4166285.1 hypothetical protein [Zavarzinia marina]